jgi:hypothetical protein
MKSVLLIALASALLAAAPATVIPNEDPGYDARFTFARLRYSMDGDGGLGMRFGGRGEPPWQHDYPTAERNLMHIITEVTSVAAYRDGGRILDVGDAELFKYPVAYMAEPGYWSMNDSEAANLRDYLLKGGFLIFDDFGGNQWANMATQMARVLPQARWLPLTERHPIFNVFFEIGSLDELLPNYRGQPSYFGLFEDNDPAKRMYAIANYNDDLGENWEYSESGFQPVDVTNQAYKFGINYMIYALTH